jgi:hypothetical protein
MKRDMDLVREILIEMEKRPASTPNTPITLTGHTADEITYHLGLMHEAGLIHAIDASSLDGEAWLPVNILWDGHEFLDAARSDTVWKKAKETVLKNTGALTIDALKVALSMAMKHAITGGF